jgi:cytochrome c553
VIWLAIAAAAAIPLCETCHGSGGNSTTAGVPSIAGQPVPFLENQLIYFREGLRNAPVMQPLMKGVKDEEITALARHFSAQDVKAAKSAAAEGTVIARGKELAGKLHCGQCHLPSYKGREQMPRLAGQREDYLVEAMIGYRDGKRTGADTTMSEVLYGMSDADVRALAAFVARQ